MELATQSTLVCHTVPVLRKAIRVLEAVAQSSEEATAKSLALTLGVSPTTCYRILQSFVAEGWLERRQNGSFELSPQMAPLFRPLMLRMQLIDSLREPLARLVRASGLTAKITVRRENSAVTIYTSNDSRNSSISPRLGLVVSLAVGSSGAIFLGSCSDEEVHRILNSAPEKVWRFQNRVDVLRRVREARRDGFCLDRGSFRANLHTISAPVYNAAGELASVVTLLGLPGDFDRRRCSTLIGQLKSSVRECTSPLLGQIPLTAA